MLYQKRKTARLGVRRRKKAPIPNKRGGLLVATFRCLPAWGEKARRVWGGKKAHRGGGVPFWSGGRGKSRLAKRRCRNFDGPNKGGMRTGRKKKTTRGEVAKICKKKKGNGKEVCPHFSREKKGEEVGYGKKLGEKVTLGMRKVALCRAEFGGRGEGRVAVW